MKCKRTLETAVETMYRKDRNRANMAKKRALESPSETMFRRWQNRVNMAKQRSMNVSIDNAVTTFLAKVNKGPDYVCTSCHRMMYKENVVVCNKSKSKYTMPLTERFAL